MQQPKYANAVAISVNQNLGEVLLSFNQVFPDLDGSFNNDLHENVNVETVLSENVCTVALPSIVANQLLDLLKNSLDNAGLRQKTNG